MPDACADCRYWVRSSFPPLVPERVPPQMRKNQTDEWMALALWCLGAIATCYIFLADWPVWVR